MTDGPHSSRDHVDPARIAAVLQTLPQRQDRRPEKLQAVLLDHARRIAVYPNSPRSMFLDAQRDRVAADQLKTAKEAVQKACDALDALNADAISCMTQAGMPDGMADDPSVELRDLRRWTHEAFHAVERPQRGRPTAIPETSLAHLIGLAYRAISGRNPTFSSTEAGKSQYVRACVSIFALFGFGQSTAVTAAKNARRLIAERYPPNN